MVPRMGEVGTSSPTGIPMKVTSKMGVVKVEEPISGRREASITDNGAVIRWTEMQNWSPGMVHT